MRKNLYVSMFVLFVAVLVLSACGTAATPTPQTVVQSDPGRQPGSSCDSHPWSCHRDPAPGRLHPDHRRRRDLPGPALFPVDLCLPVC